MMGYLLKNHYKQTFLLVRPKKRERPTRCCTADILKFLAFNSIAPAEPMTGRRDLILLQDNCGGIAIALKTLYSVGASFRHSLISLDHLNCLRSFRDVRFNKDTFFLTSLLHSLSTSKQVRLIRVFLKSLHLNAAKPKCTAELPLQRAIPRLCKLTGNSLAMVLLG